MSIDEADLRLELDALEADDETGEGATRRPRVLVIEDNPALLYILARTLVETYRVVATTSAREALRRLLGADAFDLVLCDLMMPEMTGMELFRALEQARPDLTDRVFFLTGGACTPDTQRFLEGLSGQTIRKPIAPAKLLERLSQAIERLAARRAG